MTIQIQLTTWVKKGGETPKKATTLPPQGKINCRRDLQRGSVLARRRSLGPVAPLPPHWPDARTDDRMEGWKDLESQILGRKAIWRGNAENFVKIKNKHLKATEIKQNRKVCESWDERRYILNLGQPRKEMPFRGKLPAFFAVIPVSWGENMCVRIWFKKKTIPFEMQNHKRLILKNYGTIFAQATKTRGWGFEI